MLSYDPDKPVSRTRAGYPARLICTDRKGPYNNDSEVRILVALVQESDGVENARTYFSNGRFRENSEDIYDLVNREKIDHTVYVCEHKKTKEIRVFDRDPRVGGSKANSAYEILKCTEITYERDV